jgi:RNA polymerase sigma-70 factor, ECF subfamily
VKEKNIYINESELIAGIKAGNEDAFRLLVEKYQTKVKRTCMGFVHSADDADDIAQDVFIEVFLSATKFRSDSALSTWIYRIAVNKSLNFIRNKSKRKVISLFQSVTGDDKTAIRGLVSGKEYCPDNDLKNSEHAKVIENAMNKLAPKQKTAFILSKYDDLSYDKIAGIMGTSISSVESLIFRAKQNLQKNLYHYYKKNLL